MLPRAPAVLVALAALRATAHAEDPPIRWEAPEGCPGADEVAAQVVADLGRPLREGEVDARLVVTPKGARWRVDMTVTTVAGEGERSLEAASCAELAASAALILALTIDPLAGTGAVEVEREAASDAEGATTEDLRREVEQLGDDEDPPIGVIDRGYRDVPVKTPYQPVDVDARLRVLVGGDLGTLPDAAPGVGAAIEIAFGPWSADLGVQRFAARDALMPGQDMPAGAHVGLTSVVARACYTDGPARWRTGGCLGGDLSFTRTVGFGLDENLPESTDPGGGPQAGVVAAVKLLGPLALRADVTATFLAVRAIQTVGEPGEPGEVIHDPNLLVWRGFVGVEASWE